MNTPDTDKNIAAWNDQPLDTWHDIIVSFEYARYNINAVPTGGFAVIFFEDLVDMPRNGGPGYSLGYTPSTQVDTCKPDGYLGLEGGFLGVGFDGRGNFALATNTVNGIALSSQKPQQSIAVRDSIANDFGLLYNLADNKNLNDISGLEAFTIDQSLSSEDQAVYRAVRIIISKNATELEVQIKNDINDNSFISVFTCPLVSQDRTAIKVALTNTTTDGNTKFLIKSFNVAGYPGIIQDNNLLPGCQQIIAQDLYCPPSFMTMGQEYISFPISTQLRTYTTDLRQFRQKNNIYSGNGITLFNEDRNNSFVGSYNDTSSVIVFKYLGEKSIATSVVPTSDGTYPVAAAIYNTDLVICTQPDVDVGNTGGAYIYKYNTTSADPAVIGTWSLYQTILPGTVLSGAGLGSSVSLYGDNLAIGNSNQIVHMFKRQSSGLFQFIQNITPTISGTVNFGATIAIDGQDMVIGAPYSQKQKFTNPGQGEVFHYYYSTTSNAWNLIMSLGSFYNLNTPAGNFGKSLQLKDNLLVVGSPCEAWLEDGQYDEAPNIGRVYVFNKSTNGIFTQATVITPNSAIREPYMFFGNAVNAYDKYVSVLAPFTENYNKSYLCIYDSTCLFPTPPEHISIPDCALSLYDSSGFVISIANQTYMLSLSCLLS
jgi:hypothetical protein